MNHYNKDNMGSIFTKLEQETVIPHGYEYVFISLPFTGLCLYPFAVLLATCAMYQVHSLLEIVYSNTCFHHALDSYR